MSQRSLFEDMRPFELLQLIRDGVVKNIFALQAIVNPYYVSVDDLTDFMEKVGWIQKEANGDIKPTEFISKTQTALGISLTQLAPFHRSSVVANPLFGRPKEPPKPSDLFVLRPFVTELRAVYDDHIQAVAEKVGISAARADDFFAANSIISDVWNAIAQAKLLVADCTGRNPNVFYELGISHTLGKPVILIAQSKEDIPFDVQHLRTILYEFTPRGMQEFEKTLESTISHELAIPRAHADIIDSLKRHDG